MGSLKRRAADWLEASVAAMAERVEYFEAHLKIGGFAGLVLVNIGWLNDGLLQEEPVTLWPFYLLANAAGLYVFVAWTRLRVLRERVVSLPSALAGTLKYGWLILAAGGGWLAFGPAGQPWALLFPIIAAAGALGLWFGASWGPALLGTLAVWLWVSAPLMLYLAEGDWIELSMACIQYLGVLPIPASVVALLAHRHALARRDSLESPT